jgi:hypothetical protein
MRCCCGHPTRDCPSEARAKQPSRGRDSRRNSAFWQTFIDRVRIGLVIWALVLKLFPQKLNYFFMVIEQTQQNGIFDIASRTFFCAEGVPFKTACSHQPSPLWGMN